MVTQVIQEPEVSTFNNECEEIEQAVLTLVQIFSQRNSLTDEVYLALKIILANR